MRCPSARRAARRRAPAEPAGAGVSGRAAHACVAFTRAAGLALAAVGWLGSSGCSAENAQRGGSAAVVLVLDDGFDVTLPLLAGARLASYAVRCAEPSAEPSTISTGAASATADGGSLAAGFLAALSREDEDCWLEDMPTGSASPVLPADAQQAGWNARVRDDREIDAPGAPDSVARLHEALWAALARSPYHGTATASLIAHDAPAKSLVLVQMDRDASGASFACLRQADVDGALELLSSPEARQAFVERPPSRLERELAALRARHGVGIVSESFAHPSRARVERLHELFGCGPIALADYFARLSELEGERDRALTEPGVIFVRAAGNDGSALDGPSDSRDCRPDPERLLVGGYDIAGAHDAWNFGACIGVSAPASDVVVQLPGGWLLPMSGTSFAAPLVTRWLARLAAEPTDPSTLRSWLSELADAHGDLPEHLFPAGLLYRPRALDKGRDVPPPAGEREPEAVGREEPRARADVARGVLHRAERAALERALWPIRWLEGARR